MIWDKTIIFEFKYIWISLRMLLRAVLSFDDFISILFTESLGRIRWGELAYRISTSSFSLKSNDFLPVRDYSTRFCLSITIFPPFCGHNFSVRHSFLRSEWISIQPSNCLLTVFHWAPFRKLDPLIIMRPFQRIKRWVVVL